MATNKKDNDPKLPEETDDETIDALEEEANEELSEAYDDAPRMVSEAAWNVGNQLLSACQDELTAAGVRKSSETRYILSRLERRIKTLLLEGYFEILAGAAPSVIAQLKKVTFEGEKIQGNLVIDKHTEDRHNLADFAGQDVLVVLTKDVGEHTAGMEELVAHLSEMQTELDLGEPAEMPIDLPGVGTAPDPQGKSGLEEAIDEHIAAADAELEEAEIDEARILRQDGEIVGLAPDPDCPICNGLGGWDQNVTEDGEETDEWVRCTCVELPESMQGDSS